MAANAVPSEIEIELSEAQIASATSQAFFAFTTERFKLGRFTRVTIAWGGTQPLQVFVQPTFLKGVGDAPDNYAVTCTIMEKQRIQFMVWRVDSSSKPGLKVAFHVLVFHKVS